MNRYGDMTYQRQHAQRSRACNCCGRRRFREHRPWPRPDDPDYRGAVCPVCDAAPAPTVDPS